MEQDELGCVRCGSFNNWTINSLLRSYESGDPPKPHYVYSITCSKCSRMEEWVTDDMNQVPERQKIRDELLTPIANFDPRKAAPSDEYGLDLSKVQPRLPTAGQVV